MKDEYEIKKSVEEAKKKPLSSKKKKEEHISRSEDEYAMVRPIEGEMKITKLVEKLVAKPAKVIAQEHERYSPEMPKISAPKIEGTQPEFNQKAVSKISIQYAEEKPEKEVQPEYSQGPLQGKFPEKGDLITSSGIKQVEQPQRAPQSQFPSEQQPREAATERLGEHTIEPGSLEHQIDKFLEQSALLPPKVGGSVEPDTPERKEAKNLRR